ncbi:hypothetical protein [Amycolatopsis sp. lyj-346]|uniref:hypothetical protein n=1 Tax=Amycolatopsis sp. lyj-346 TaxID=2789289 RepID=UPI00397CCB63
METLVIVVSAEGWNLDVVADSLKSSHRVSLTDRCLEVSQATSSAYVCVVDPDEELIFEEWPEELIPRTSFTAFSVDYRDPALAESIVRLISANAPAVVDTNFGEVVSGSEFVARVDLGDPVWEWWHWRGDPDGSSR